ncbi:MAG: TlpA family protein disulfide reductase [Alphaproteobacteria bacterium]|nr:TlpA family protein disulfide reductase [Alphaproteobacteria bacterium]
MFFSSSLKGENTVSSSSLKGKVVLIDFWASWCVPCKASFPAYNDFYRKYKDKVFEIVGINIDDNKDKERLCGRHCFLERPS